MRLMLTVILTSLVVVFLVFVLNFATYNGKRSSDIVNKNIKNNNDQK